jgi:hypothetical protein
MLKQFSFFTLLILATSSLAIAGQNDPCDKYGYIGAKWLCNSIWGNSQQSQQKLPDVTVPNLESKPNEMPAPIVKEEPTIQTPQEKVLVRSTTTFIADKNSNKEEVKTINNDEQNTMRTFEVESYDVLYNAKQEAQNKNLIGILKIYFPFLSLNAMRLCTNPKIKNTGDRLYVSLHQDHLFIRRTKKQFLFKIEVLKAFWHEIIKK